MGDAAVAAKPSPPRGEGGLQGRMRGRTVERRADEADSPCQGEMAEGQRG